MKYFALAIDEDHEAQLTRHGVTVADVVQVLRSDPIATVTTDGERRIKIAFDHEDGRVRPITAWEL